METQSTAGAARPILRERETRADNGLARLEAGMMIPFGGDKFTRVDARLAAEFQPGDALVVCQSDGALLHIKADARRLVSSAIGEATSAFLELREIPSAYRGRFFGAFARRLEEDEIWIKIQQANEADVSRARDQGRDVGRLALDRASREAMIDGLRRWDGATCAPEEPLGQVDHGSWSVEALRAPLGTIGFIFEGRPNVLVDACGVLASGNAAVLRIGADAAATADTILRLALRPALDEAGLPRAAMTVLPLLGREAGWAMFTDRRLALAVARGSGPAVRQLGDIATQSGIPVSLHGTGGAWLLADRTASIERFAMVVAASLDRKVCNTLNTCLIVRSRAGELVPALVASLMSAARPFHRNGKLHVLAGSERYVPKELFDLDVPVDRGGEMVSEKFAASIEPEGIGEEWEWERTPEITLAIVDDLKHGVELINRHSSRFVASLISDDPSAHERFYDGVEAPFVGDGFTRWVDGQYALQEPEMGLSNWQYGRPLGRPSVLTGAGVHTVRLRMRQADPMLSR